MNGTTRGLRLGRVFGIDLAVDYSWLFIAVLMTWSLAAAFATWHSDWSAATSLVTAIVATLLFFGSVVLHELAHSLVARRFGLPVRRITLFLFGGISDIEREPSSAKAEFLTAVVGPITSILLGFVLLAVASMTADIPPGLGADRTATLAVLGPGQTLLAWLGSVNVLVGVFNLIPAFPLDGGRLLRSAIWAAKRDLHTATRWASAAGQAIGWGFVFLGVAIAFGANVPFFGRGIIAGLWLTFIGWFLSSAAAQSWYRQLAQEVLVGVPVSRLMRPLGSVVRADTTVGEFVDDWLMRSDDPAFVVVDEAGRPVGLATLADVRRALGGTSREARGEMRIGQVMTPLDKLETANPREDLSVALDKLSRADVGQLPVLDGGRLVGLLFRRDVAKWIELHLQSPAQRYAH